MKRASVLGVTARLRKLRAMSAHEIAHRVRYKVRLATERRQHAAGSLVAPDRLERALVPALAGRDWRPRLLQSRRAGRDRIFASIGQRDAMREIFSSHYRRELDDTTRLAAAARGRQFSFFGQTFSYEGDIPWQADPVTGRDWPAVYHADVPVHGGDVGYGDVKHVWELSRHQFLIDLGKSWFLTGNRDDLDALRALVRSWNAGNPYATGVNWSCALEPAFRVFSWLWAYALTTDGLDDDFHEEWLRAFLDHGRFIERHFEHYTSPYNHLMGEAAALYMLGAHFPEFADAPRWRATARDVLTTRLGEQFYADGGTVEQSTFYHHATLGFYLLAGLTARAIGDDLPAAAWEAVQRGLDFSLMLTQPDGTTPAIGGADDGKPIRMEHLPLWDFRPYLAIGAVVFRRGDYKRVAGRFHEDALWLLGPEGRRTFEALPDSPDPPVSEARPASGYYVMRSGWTPEADYVCVDCGEQAAGMRQDAVPNSMHGHADCLSVVAWLGGRKVLVDSGLYSYNAGGAWEAHFRETAAHSTATVDGRDQARHIGKMAWSHSYAASPEAWHADAADAWFTGSHDGYARGPAGVTHRRSVWLRPGTCLAIYDEFDGSGGTPHDFAVHFQFAPGDLRDAGGAVLFDDVVEMRWASPGWEARLASGGPEPGDGWIAPSLGIKVPAPRVTLRRTSSDARLQLLTVFTLRTRAARLVSIPPGSDGRPMIAVVGSHVTDVIAAPRAGSGGVLAMGRVTDDGRATWRTTGPPADLDETTLRTLAGTARMWEP